MSATSGWRLLAALASVGLAFTQSALAQDTIRVGKSVPIAWTFTPLDIGVEMGIFEKHKLKVEISAFGGDARMQQALAANSIDMGLGSGPGMGFASKGVPAKAVAAFAGAPKNLGLVIHADDPYNNIKEMKGKKFAVTTIGSLTHWLLKRAALAQGWKHDDLTAVPLGGFETNYAAFKTRQVDGIVLAVESIYLLLSRGEGKYLGNMAPYAPRFHTHVIFARDEMQEKNPELVKRFLAGWFETIAYIKANKQKSVEIAARILKSTPEIIGRAYDEQISMLQDNGKFDPEAIKLIKQTLVEMEILDKEPPDEKIFTTKFVQ